MTKKAVGAAVVLLLVSIVVLCYVGEGNFIVLEFLKLWGILNTPKPDFEISANPESLTLHSWGGSQGRTVITVKSVGGFSDSITFRVEHSGIVGDIGFVFDHSQMTLLSGGQVQCELTLSVNSVVSPGIYNVDIIATASDLKQHSVRVTLTVSSL